MAKERIRESEDTSKKSSQTEKQIENGVKKKKWNRLSMNCRTNKNVQYKYNGNTRQRRKKKRTE